MSLNKALALVVLVGLSILAVTYGDIPELKPAGLWYVVATHGYNDTLPVPKCWTINIREPLGDGNFECESNLIDQATFQHHHRYFRASIYPGRSSLDNAYHYFELSMTTDDDETIEVDSIAFYQFVTSHGTVELSNMTIAGQTWKYFEQLYISRTAELDTRISFIIPKDVARVDNSNCEINYISNY